MTVSSGWPIVWPKLSGRRRSASYGSRSISAVLIADAPRTSRSSAAASRARIACASRADQAPVLGRGDHRLLDALGQAGGDVAALERAQARDVGDHRGRLVERAEQVLRERVVDGDLAAERAVDLREQRRRQVHVRDPAHVRARDPAAEVGDHAAAEREDHVAARERAAREPAPQPDRLLEALARLAGRDRADEHVAAELAQPADQARREQRLDDLVGDDRDAAALHERREPLAASPPGERVMWTG